MCINAGMPDCPASDQSGTGLKKLMMPGVVRYRTKPRQSGIFLVRYRTKIIDAGVNFLDANAQLCVVLTNRSSPIVISPKHNVLEIVHLT
jgi:hypothetical protein